MAKTNHKGPGRPGKPGRHPAKDPKKPVLFYMETSVIKANGGVAKCRELCKDFLAKREAALTLDTFLNPKKQPIT